MRNLLFLCLLCIAGCASTEKYQSPEGLNLSNSARVFLYRTAVLYHSANPEQPFFYLNNKLVGNLGTGSFVTFYVKPGQHVLTSKESILFMPSNESGKISGQFEAGKTYYFRYSKDFVSVTGLGSGFVMSDSSSLTIATEQQFLDKT
ncbi:MAG: DUF2846 domain-containing protein [Gammaproteobacteria bacterium]|jgi:hypothetical protein|nr:DUF2846 domain-containing protein [Gammaproteobacteria bacterium]